MSNRFEIVPVLDSNGQKKSFISKTLNDELVPRINYKDGSPRIFVNSGKNLIFGFDNFEIGRLVLRDDDDDDDDGLIAFEGFVLKIF